MSCGGQKEHDDGSNKDRYNENYDKISKTVEDLNSMELEPGMHRATTEEGRVLFHDLTRDYRVENGIPIGAKLGLERQAEIDEWARRRLPIRMAYAMRDDAWRRTAVAEPFDAQQAGVNPAEAVGEGYMTEHVSRIVNPDDPRNGMWEVQRDHFYVNKTNNHTTGEPAYTVEGSSETIICTDPSDPGGTEFESTQDYTSVDPFYYRSEDEARASALAAAKELDYVATEEMEYQTRQLADRLTANGGATAAASAAAVAAAAQADDDDDEVVPYGENDEYFEDGWTDAEADADTLASAGWGTDEDYGYYGDDGGYGEY